MQNQKPNPTFAVSKIKSMFPDYDDYKLDNPYHDEYEDDEPDYDLMRDMMREEEYELKNQTKPCKN